MLNQLKSIAADAGKEIMKIYDHENFESEIRVEFKSDSSPLTLADQKAHMLIQERLKSLYPEIPIISEESTPESYEDRKNWDQFFMIDPIDGTKEFIKRNGEFTVNIALIQNGKPKFGVIYAPAINEMYSGEVGRGAYLETSNQSRVIKCKGEIKKEITFALSKSHLSEETLSFVNQFSTRELEINRIRVGSSLKLCMVASGQADAYPRIIPTREWDIAAGECILRAAGGLIIQKDNHQPIEYNKANFKNPKFIACSNDFYQYYQKLL